jgi:hypothetical protein
VDLPVAHDGDFYSVYFSAGVLLEAKLLAARLPAGTQHVVQVYREDDLGAAAAQSFPAADGMRVDNYPLKIGADAAQLAAALAHATAGDALILWLRPEDLRQLPAAASPASTWISGLMGGLSMLRCPLPGLPRPT